MALAPTSARNELLLTHPLQINPAALGQSEAQPPARAAASAASPSQAATPRPSHRYISVRWKFAFALSIGLVWMGFSIYAADAWVHDLASVVSPWAAYPIIYGIAVVPVS